LPYFYPATVVKNDDPKGLRRVKFTIPGLIEPESPWALPMATAGGGSEKRGGSIVPEIRATIGVQFAFGDPAHPYYFCGPQAEGEPQETDPDKFVLRYDDFEVRWEKEAQILSVKNTRTGDEVTFNGITASVSVYAVGELAIEAAGRVSISGAIVEINGRPVMPGGPI
jgi:hypothetical protein